MPGGASVEDPRQVLAAGRSTTNASPSGAFEIGPPSFHDLSSCCHISDTARVYLDLRRRGEQ